MMQSITLMKMIFNLSCKNFFILKLKSSIRAVGFKYFSNYECLQLERFEINLQKIIFGFLSVVGNT